MEVKTEFSNGKLTAHLAGEIDHHTASAARSEIDTAITRHRPEVLCLDFGGVGFADSSGIGLIMGRYRVMNGLSGSVELCGLSAELDKIMKLSGIGRLPGISMTEGKNKNEN